MEPNHKIYQSCDKKDADALAWSFLSNEKFGEYPYKHPELAADEIRANILYSGLCLSDVMTGRSKWGAANYPITPGHEIVAEVSQLGSEVTDFSVGDKVAFGTMRKVCGNCKYCKRDREVMCTSFGSEKFTYNPYFGGYSTTLQQPASHFFKLPSDMDLEKTAPLLCAGVTVYTPMRRYLEKDMTCAVIGVGGLGHLAVKFLKAKGHYVAALTTSLSKKDFIMELGTDEVICSTDPEQMKANRGKFDFVISTIPNVKDMQSYIDLVAPAGYYVNLGIGEFTETAVIVPGPLVVMEKHIVGSLVGSRDDVKEMLAFCYENKIYPIVEEYKFEEFDKALDRLENGKPIFRVVVNTQEFSKKNGYFK